jgi:hypothetical protein
VADNRNRPKGRITSLLPSEEGREKHSPGDDQGRFGFRLPEPYPDPLDAASSSAGIRRMTTPAQRRRAFRIIEGGKTEPFDIFNPWFWMFWWVR